MEKLLVLTHVDESGEALTKASLEAVAAGMEMAGALEASVTIGIVGARTETAAQQVAGTAVRVLAVAGEAFGLRQEFAWSGQQEYHDENRKPPRRTLGKRQGGMHPSSLTTVSGEAIRSPRQP